MRINLFGTQLAGAAGCDDQRTIVTDFPLDHRRDTTLGQVRRFMACVVDELPAPRASSTVGLIASSTWETPASVLALAHAGWRVVVLPQCSSMWALEALLGGHSLTCLVGEGQQLRAIGYPDCIPLGPHRHGNTFFCSLQPVRTGERKFAEDERLVLFTSGSISNRRGVVFSRDAVANWQIPRNPSKFEKASGIIFAQLAHITPLVAALSAIQDARHVFLPGGFEPKRAVAIIREAQPEILSGTATMLRMLMPELRKAAPGEFSSIKRFNIYGEALNAGLKAQIERYFPLARPVNGYGMTEAGGTIFSPLPQGAQCVPDGSCGKLARDEIEWRLDEQSAELQIRSPRLASRYLNDDEATQRRFVDGWFLTGDRFRRDDAGFFFHQGRIDGCFKSAGIAVLAESFERECLSRFDLRDAVVVPVDTETGNRVACALICADGNPQEAIDAVEKSADGQSGNLLLTAVFGVESLPMLPSGKVDRKAAASLAGELLSKARCMSEKDCSKLAQQSLAANALHKIFARLLAKPDLTNDCDLVDAGMDSLLATLATIEAEAGGIPLQLMDIFEHRSISNMIGSILHHHDLAASARKTL